LQSSQGESKEQKQVLKKEKVMKKVFAVVLVAVALVAVFPMAANATDTTKVCVPMLRPCRAPMPPSTTGGNSNGTKSGGSGGSSTTSGGGTTGRPLPPSRTR
jgi:uncharacterized membrane protein